MKGEKIKKNNCKGIYSDKLFGLNIKKNDSKENESCSNNSCDCCKVGPAGPQGPIGETGPAGGILAFADFYALMPPDNAATVAPGAFVDFPQDGPTSGNDITRSSADSFSLNEIGSYLVLFQVNITEAGQLILNLNNTPLEYTVVGRATGTSQIVTTTSINSVLSVQNPAGNPTALTITPVDGGTNPISAHLTILRIQ